MSLEKAIEKSTTIRVKLSSYDHIKKLAEKEKITIQEAIDRLLEDYKRKKFFEDINNSILIYKHNNPNEWEEDQKERDDWDRIQDSEDDDNETW
jgi:hypothetical protein